jgi:hypothetical protein
LRVDRTTDNFARLHREEIERLADAALHAVERLTANRQEYREMRRNARATAASLFSAKDASEYWDDLYEVSMRLSR